MTLLTTAFLLAFSPFSLAQNYVLEKGKVYEFDSLTDIESFESRGAISLTFGSVNSPSGLMNIDIATKPGATYIPGTTQYLSTDIYHPEVLFKSNVVIGGIRWATGGTLNGNLTAIPDGSIADYGLYVQDCIENFGGTAQLTTGAIILGGNEKRPITINGNVVAPILLVRSHSIRPDEGDYTYYGYNVINGDIKVDFLSTDNFTHYDDLTDYLEVSGTVTVQRDFFNNGSSNIKKLIVYGSFLNGNGEYSGKEEDKPLEQVGATIGELDALNIINGSNLYVDTLTNSREQTYTQTFGTIQVKDNWFTNSTINMSGGIINEASLGPDKNLGINNVFNVTGGTLIVGDLNFDSTVNLSQDGKIQTDIESIFINPDGDPEALNYVGLDASEPESVKASLTKWFTNYVAGTLRTDLEDHVNFNGGSIVISGFGKITETQYQDLLEAFKEAFLNSIRKDLFQA